MASDIVPGTPRVPDSGDEGHDSPGAGRGPVSGPAPQPASTDLPPSSGDELSLSLAESLAMPRPDPFLGEFHPAATTASGTPISPPSPPDDGRCGLAEFGADEEDEAHWGLTPPTASDALAGLDLRDPEALNQLAGVATTPKSFDALKAIQTGRGRGTLGAADGVTRSPSSFDAFSAIDLDVAPAPRPDLDPEEHEEDEDEDLPPHRASWPMILLASYASAVTLGLIWVLWGNRVRGTAEADPVASRRHAPRPGSPRPEVPHDRPPGPDRPRQADGAGPAGPDGRAGGDPPGGRQREGESETPVPAARRAIGGHERPEAQGPIAQRLDRQGLRPPG